MPLPVAPAAGDDLRRSTDIPVIRFMTYNVENLFYHVGDFDRVAANNFKKIKPPQDKNPTELQGVAQAISESNPDILVLEEVEGLQSLADFDKNYLQNIYNPILLPGNDARGIEIGFLIKKDLPLKVVTETHKDMTWKDPAEGMREVPLFSRDLPVLLFYGINDDPAKTKPLFAVVGNHGKSKRNRPGDRLSQVLRTAQYEAASKIIESYYQRFGPQFPILMAGDFNTDVRTSPEVASLKGDLKDALDLVQYPTDARVTQTFHPRNGPTQKSQLDGVLLSPSLSPFVTSAAIYRYKDASGRIKPIPETYDQRSLNPSDHFPIVVDLSSNLIFPEAHQPVRNAVSGN